MNTKGFGLVALIVLVGLLVLGGFWYFKNQKNKSENQPQNIKSTTTQTQTTQEVAPSPMIPKTTTVPVKKKAATPVPTSTTTTATATVIASNENIDYGQAINLYSSTRIQFNASCQASPSSINIKSGTKIMLDNRSDMTRTITVGGVKFNLSGYGFKIVTVSNKTLPQIVAIDCGSSKNNAQINLQK